MKYLISCLLCLCLFACHDATLSNLHDFVQRASANTVSLPPLPALTEQQPLAFHPHDEKDPFSPVKLQSESLVPVIHQRCLPVRLMQHQDARLADYAINTLTMHGTLTVRSQRSAIIEAPNHRFYQVNLGNHVGKEQAKVESISTNAKRSSRLHQFSP